MDKPVTEQSNYVTKDIDVASADGEDSLQTLKQVIVCVFHRNRPFTAPSGVTDILRILALRGLCGRGLK